MPSFPESVGALELFVVFVAVVLLNWQPIEDFLRRTWRGPGPWSGSR